MRSEYSEGVEECVSNHIASHSKISWIVTFCLYSNTIFLEVVPLKIRRPNLFMKSQDNSLNKKSR